MSGTDKKEKNRKLLIIILIIAIALCIAVTVWALFFRQPKDTMSPDYAPQVLEPNAIPVSDADESKLDAPEGGGAISLEYDDKVTIDLTDAKAYLNYSNPGKSTQDIVLRIEIQDTAVAQSGTIPPGNRLNELELLEGAENMLKEGVYTDAVFRILSYDPDTGEKAMVDTLAEITVTVNP